MDGTTTCNQVGETLQQWGPCMGAVLPNPSATSGAQACQCFSHGLWALDNTEPCFSYTVNGMTMTFTSGESSQPPTGMSIVCPNPAPTMPWSNDTVTADCAGHFKLCYALKAGDGMNPKSTDCQIEKVCTEGDYLQVGKAQSFPALPSWTSMNGTCIQQFNDSGGYGEMSVSGTSVTCDALADHVFLRVSYCKACCNNTGGGPTDCHTDPACANCSNGGSGMF
jgi:hypothetical protein